MLSYPRADQEESMFSLENQICGFIQLQMRVLGDVSTVYWKNIHPTDSDIVIFCLIYYQLSHMIRNPCVSEPIYFPYKGNINFIVLSKYKD